MLTESPKHLRRTFRPELGLALIEEARRAAATEIDTVSREVGIGGGLLARWRAWLDDDGAWPPFSALAHGDRYAAHVLIDGAARATGVLDWTEAAVGDPSVDFTFHLMGFGEAGFERLLAEYEAAGGRTWPGMRRHVAERVSAVPVK